MDCGLRDLLPSAARTCDQRGAEWRWDMAWPRFDVLGVPDAVEKLFGAVNILALFPVLDPVDGRVIQVP